jgi:hypothetical protein
MAERLHKPVSAFRLSYYARAIGTDTDYLNALCLDYVNEARNWNSQPEAIYLALPKREKSFPAEPGVMSGNEPFLPLPCEEAIILYYPSETFKREGAMKILATQERDFKARRSKQRKPCIEVIFADIHDERDLRTYGDLLRLDTLYESTEPRRESSGSTRRMSPVTF